MVEFIPDNADFSYTSDDLIAFFSTHKVESIVLINPDNPSGNYIPKTDVLYLAKWAYDNSVRLIVDESFVDFSSEVFPDSSLLDPDILMEYPGMVVVKSISKSFGVPGLRLGVLATGDAALLGLLKKELAIWNINSFGEFFLQIFEKYQLDYISAVQDFKDTRAEFIKQLSAIKGIRIIPTQANFVMCEITSDITSKELAEKLLNNYQILIKDLAEKKGVSGQFIRLAIKTPEENKKLAFAIIAVFSEQLQYNY